MRFLGFLALATVLMNLGCGDNGPRTSTPTQEYQKLQLAPRDATVGTGTTVAIAGFANRFIAVGFRSDGGTDSSWDLLVPAAGTTWKSSNPSIVSIDNQGRFVAASAGLTTISATLGSLSASTTMVVSDTAPTLTAVQMYPGLPLLDGHGNVVGIHFQALASYDDHSEQDVTGNGVWTSSDPASCTVDSSGAVIYKSMTNCRISFLYGLSYNTFKIDAPV